MIDNLKKQRDIIAFEASVETQITDFMKSGFERVYGDVRGFLSGFATPPSHPKITKENKDFLNIVAKTSFVELMDLPAFVPEGVVVDYLTYINVLHDATTKLQRLVPNLLNNYASFLGTIINFEDKAKGSWVSFEALLKKEEIEFERIVARLKSCSKEGRDETRVTIDKVVGRNADWTSVFKELGELNSDFYRINHNDIKKAIEQCVVNLDIIKKNINNGKYGDASHETVKTLSDMAYSVATELEFYAIIYYKIESLNKSIKDTCNGIVEIYSHK